MRCPHSGECVHERDVVAALAYCPECQQLVAVFRTSELRPYNARFTNHDRPTPG